MLFPSAVHVSSTFESEAPRSYCVALFANSPFSTFYSETHECHCLALFMHPPPSSLEPREIIKSCSSPIFHFPLFSEPHEFIA